jgi:hypothetical protein
VRVVCLLQLTVLAEPAPDSRDRPMREPEPAPVFEEEELFEVVKTGQQMTMRQLFDAGISKADCAPVETRTLALPDPDPEPEVSYLWS